MTCSECGVNIEDTPFWIKKYGYCSIWCMDKWLPSEKTVVLKMNPILRERLKVLENT